LKNKGIYKNICSLFKMEIKNLLRSDQEDAFLNRRTFSSRKGTRSITKNIASQQSARTIQGARSINLKRNLFLGMEVPTTKFIPKDGNQNGQNIRLKKVASQRNFSKGTVNRQAFQQSLGTVFPPMK
jgi:hypothetical protein